MICQENSIKSNEKCYNIILRYLIGDDPEKAASAGALMEQVEKGHRLIEIPTVVTAEIIWTLEKFYKVPRSSIVEKLLAIFYFRGVQGADKKVIINALHSYNSLSIDFVDCFLAASSVEHSKPIYSFDEKDFRRLEATWEMP